jgi:hypothetical protein
MQRNRYAKDSLKGNGDRVETGDLIVVLEAIREMGNAPLRAFERRGNFAGSGYGNWVRPSQVVKFFA